MKYNTSMTTDFIHIVKERGFIHQISEEEKLVHLLNTSMCTAYIGFDCTAPSLHIGNLMGVMMLRWFQKTGHKPIALLGGGTTKIGDPSGKEQSRQILTYQQIEKNKLKIKDVFKKFLHFDTADNACLIEDNDSWLSQLNYIDFLRDYGKHFSVNRMLTMDSVRLRLDREQFLSFLEFNYMVLQAYDFVELYRRHGCILQMGGSDQWGNIVSGIDLGRRCEAANLFALTCPLLTTNSGNKMGKSVDGAIWLNEDMFSVYDYWQYWRNTEDADVGRFLRIYTEISIDEIKKLEILQGQEINEAKVILANAVTSLAHGNVKTKEAYKTAQQTFDQGVLSPNLPTFATQMQALKQGMGLLDLLVKIGFCKTNSEARRHITNNAIRVNDTLVTDVRYTLYEKDLIQGNIKISLGKKKHFRVTIE